MPQFKFNTISRADIERSEGGNIMIQAIDYNGQDHQIVTGVPGSGKTTVTIMRAERLANTNSNILIFTLHKLLAISLKNIAPINLKPQIQTFHKWYSSVTNKRWASEDDLDQMQVFLKDLPHLDEILIDEGQDFEDKVFRSLLAKCNQMTIGADDAQKIHENGLNVSEIKHELGQTRNVVSVPLNYNYRNTFEIYNFARYFLPDNERAPIPLKLMPRGGGNTPIVIQVLSDDEKFNRIKIILENAEDRNVAILLYHHDEVNSYYNKINGLGFSCTKHHSNAHADDNIENILITTYKSAKGLEFQVVIMPDMHTAMNSEDKTPEHYYIGCTRAREYLYLTYTGMQLPDHFNDFAQDSYELIPTEMAKKQDTSTNFDDLPF